MVREFWRLLREGVEAFIEDDALSHGAAIAFYTITAFAPVLYIAAAIAGMAFGWEAASSALRREISHLIGPDGAKLVHGVEDQAEVVRAVLGAWVTNPQNPVWPRFRGSNHQGRRLG